MDKKKTNRISDAEYQKMGATAPGNKITDEARKATAKANQVKATNEVNDLAKTTALQAKVYYDELRNSGLSEENALDMLLAHMGSLQDIMNDAIGGTK